MGFFLFLLATLTYGLHSKRQGAIRKDKKSAKKKERIKPCSLHSSSPIMWKVKIKDTPLNRADADTQKEARKQISLLKQEVNSI